MSVDPRASYEALRDERAATALTSERRARSLSNLRLASFLAFLACFGASLFAGWSGLWMLLPAACFSVLVVLHARAAAVAERASAGARFHAEGLARLDEDWAGRGRSGADLEPAGHVYAADLDLFGKGSLFERLCSARTRLGEERLAAWLLAPAPAHVVRSRQQAVAELAPRLDLREDLAVLEGGARSALERGAASAWARAPVLLEGRGLVRVHAALALLSTGLLIAWLGFGLAPGWMLIAMLAQFVVAARERAAVQQVLEAADRPAQDLALVRRILERLETERFESPHLAQCLRRLAADGASPSVRIQGLTRLMDLVDARRNQIVLPLSWLGSLGTQAAHALERWRRRHAAALLEWLDVVAEVEALASLAAYAHEAPEDGFPEIVEEPVLVAESLGHPLLPAAKNVRNDVRLARRSDAPQGLLISGSNMSGKSTLLRSVGVAVVMAFAGAPVRARGLRVGPLAVGASIRLHDSLQEGASRFYAEIARLRQIVDLTDGDATVLFLVDEILHGTNSHDRRIGAAAVLRSLLRAGALGLVTTHDLALARIAEEPGLRVTNMHFEDQVREGRIHFDYRLRPGVVTRGNALALMRMVGLEVSDDEADAGT